jgi:hypothetical protein
VQGEPSWMKGSLWYSSSSDRSRTTKPLLSNRKMHSRACNIIIRFQWRSPRTSPSSTGSHGLRAAA